MKGAQCRDTALLAHEKAMWATDRARRLLQDLGFSVGIPNHVAKNGVDLFVSRPGRRAFAVEVKLAMLSPCKRGAAWRVNRVTRKKDDLIAIVFPCGYVLLSSMKDHLKRCNRSGDRYFTELGRFLEG